MLTEREKQAMRMVAGTCGLWLLVAGLVAGYAFVQNQDAQDEVAARQVMKQ